MGIAELKVESSRRLVMVRWAVTALSLALANIALKFVRLGGGQWEGPKIVEVVTYGLAAFLFAGLCLFWKAQRSWAAYFKVASVLGALVLASGILQMSK